MTNKSSDMWLLLEISGFIAVVIGGMVVYNQMHPTIAHDATGIIIDTEVRQDNHMVDTVIVPIVTHYALVDINNDGKSDRRVELTEEEFEKAIPGKSIAFTYYED